MSASPLNAAIRFGPEAYQLPEKGLVGRHSAGVGFLRAAVQGRGEEFAAAVRAIDPAAEARWFRSDRFDQFNALKRACGCVLR